jgi:hypothetical protein
MMTTKKGTVQAMRLVTLVLVVPTASAAVAPAGAIVDVGQHW